MSDIIIIGAGGHAKSVADAVLKSGNRLLGFLDDNKTGKVIGDYRVLAKTDDAPKFKDDAFFIIGIGNNEVRKKIAQKYDGILRWKTIIHPLSNIAIGAQIGQGSAILAYSVINSDATIGKHCILNTASVAEHDSTVGDFCHISVGSALCGEVTVGSSCFIGAKACIRQSISVCDNVTVGCGGAVVKDITESGIYAGVPAKRIDKK